MYLNYESLVEQMKSNNLSVYDVINYAISNHEYFKEIINGLIKDLKIKSDPEYFKSLHQCLPQALQAVKNNTNIKEAFQYFDRPSWSKKLQKEKTEDYEIHDKSIINKITRDVINLPYEFVQAGDHFRLNTNLVIINNKEVYDITS